MLWHCRRISGRRHTAHIGRRAGPRARPRGLPVLVVYSNSINERWQLGRHRRHHRPGGQPQAECVLRLRCEFFIHSCQWFVNQVHAAPFGFWHRFSVRAPRAASRAASAPRLPRYFWTPHPDVQSRGMKGGRCASSRAPRVRQAIVLKHARRLMNGKQDGIGECGGGVRAVCILRGAARSGCTNGLRPPR